MAQSCSPAAPGVNPRQAGIAPNGSESLVARGQSAYLDAVPDPFCHNGVPLAEIAAGFMLGGPLAHLEVVPTGHINSTFRVTSTQEDGSLRRFILQSINHAVFPDPAAVMRNVEIVTAHILAKEPSGRRDSQLELVPTRDGGHSLPDSGGSLWRCYRNIENSITVDIVSTPAQAFEAARAFGRFQRLLRDLDPSLLAVTIPDFHNTPQRLARLEQAIAADAHGRAQGAREEIRLIRERAADTALLADLAASGLIPTRVVHNDTKINNVMLNPHSGEAVCVIDLDTVMPGLAPHDFGDLVRSAVSPAAEDEPVLAKVAVRMDMFRAMARGFLGETAAFLGETERSHLPDGCRIITLELAIRFLTDHLEGDHYFRTSRPGHNLDRCRNQLRLVQCMEEADAEMREAVAEAAG